MESTTFSTSSSSVTTSTRIFGTNSTVYSAPRYTSVCPFWRPYPCTSLTVRPVTPRACRPSLTASSWYGLMTAVTSFMPNPSIKRTLTGDFLGYGLLRLGLRGGGTGRADTGQGERAGLAAARAAGGDEVVGALRVLGDVDALD